MENHGDDYTLECPRCHNRYFDDGVRLECDICKEHYQRGILKYIPAKQIDIDKSESGLSRYRDFLPGKTYIDFQIPTTYTFKSSKFADRFGFKNLFFTCTGFSPHLRISARTASFKELEALCVLHRLQSFGQKKPLVLASAGNTARAFAYYAAKNRYPTIIVVPEVSRRFIWLPNTEEFYKNAQEFVRLIVLKQPAKYLHASMFAKKLLQKLNDRVLSEGGFFNVGRIAGLGCCALNFFDIIGRIPKHYVQAVGSGSGVLAAIRAYELLDQSQSREISYHLVQNAPYDPLIRAMNSSGRFQPNEHYEFIDTVCSPMLTSGDPAFDYAGGLLESKMSGVSMFGHSVTNSDIYNMHREMQMLEKIQIALPSAAAVAGLLKAKEKGALGPNDIIQVNITGCGETNSKSDEGFFYVNPCCASVPEQVSFGGRNFEEWYLGVENEILEFI